MKIVFFDGHCSLCNASVDWLMRADSSGAFKFASLQGKTAAEMLAGSSGPIELNTIIYLRDEQKFDQSTAVLLILSDVGGLWRAAKIFLLVPKIIRDSIYRLVASNRYRFIKKRMICRMPSQKDQDRLLP
jgi:predicted DCC family thiol-disulfide oxidoreductase YuxK